MVDSRVRVWSRIPVDTARVVDDLAQASGLSRSDVVSMLIVLGARVLSAPDLSAFMMGQASTGGSGDAGRRFAQDCPSDLPPEPFPR